VGVQTLKQIMDEKVTSDVSEEGSRQTIMKKVDLQQY
jgi:hypothetical protein